MWALWLLFLLSHVLATQGQDVVKGGTVICKVRYSLHRSPRPAYPPLHHLH
jgi:hypothetical protein